MRRVPLPVVILAVPVVIGATWWSGTRQYDFLKPPTATEIETARSRASLELARPSDLFAIDRLPENEPTTAQPSPPEPPPAPKPKPPRIDVSDPAAAAPLDAWITRSDLPAGSFIELASRLEAEGHLSWARTTWERVIDLAEASSDDREVAVRAIARIRASMPPPAETPAEAPEIHLQISAPADRVGLTRRAAEEAAAALTQATDRRVKFAPKVISDSGESASLATRLVRASEAAEELPSVAVDAPSDPDALRRAILQSAFKLVASELAVHDELQPISPPLEGEPPAESLATRITRRAWDDYAAGPTQE